MSSRNLRRKKMGRRACSCEGGVLRPRAVEDSSLWAACFVVRRNGVVGEARRLWLGKGVKGVKESAARQPVSYPSDADVRHRVVSIPMTNIVPVS